MLSDEKKIEIVKLTDDGLNRPEIAKIIGCSVTTVYKYQRRYHPTYVR